MLALSVKTALDLHFLLMAFKKQDVWGTLLLLGKNTNLFKWPISAAMVPFIQLSNDRKLPPNPKGSCVHRMNTREVRQEIYQ